MGKGGIGADASDRRRGAGSAVVLTRCSSATCRRPLSFVGPNGAGKTNLLRLLQIVLAAIDRAATLSQDACRVLMRFAASRRLGSAPADISGVRLGITLTESSERELLASFVRARDRVGDPAGQPTKT
jgi:hypothetical protein